MIHRMPASNTANTLLAIQHHAFLVLFAAIPFSRALFNTALAVIIVVWLLNAGKSMRSVFTNSLSLLAIFLVLWVFVGALYSAYPMAHLTDLLSQYAPWLIIPILVSQARALDHRNYLNAFLLGATLLAMQVVVSQWVVIPWARSTDNLQGGMGLFYHYISQSVIIAVLACFYLVKSIEAKTMQIRLAWLLGYLLLSFTILHWSESRTGYVALVAGFLTLAVVHVNRKTVRVLLPVTLLVLTLFASSHTVQDRMQTAVQEIQGYQNVNNYTSMGARVRMWDISLDAIEERPWVGHGSRSYGNLSRNIFNDDKMCAIGCLHPHNQFLLFGVENGLVGMLLFSGFFMAFALAACRATKTCGALAPVVAIFLVVSLFDSSLNYIAFTHTFIPLIAIAALVAEQAKYT